MHLGYGFVVVLLASEMALLRVVAQSSTHRTPNATQGPPHAIPNTQDTTPSITDATTGIQGNVPNTPDLTTSARYATPRSTSNPNSAVIRCREKADIVLILDGSGSIDSREFNIMRNFTKRLIGSFDVGLDRVRFGLLQFSSYVTVEFNLNSYGSISGMYKKVDNMYKKDSGTNTHVALQKVRGEMLTEMAGDRPLVPDIAIVLTDGKSNAHSITLQEARKFKRGAAVSVFSVGVGTGTNATELEAIASHPPARFVHTLPDFSTLVQYVKELVNNTCTVVKEEAKKICVQKRDMAFVIDTSLSVGQENYVLIDAFMGKLLSSHLPVSRDRVRVAAVTVGGDARVMFGLDQMESAISALDALDMLAPTRGSTSTHDGLSLVRSNVFQASNGERSQVHNVAVMISDGRYRRSDATLREADELRRRGVEVFAVGVGRVRLPALQAIASTPYTDHVFQLHNSNTSALQNMVDSLSQHACNATRPQITPEQCDKNVDVMVVVDVTGRVNGAQFSAVKSFINNVAARFQVTRGAARVGVVSCANEAAIAIRLGDHLTQQSVVGAVGRLPLPGNESCCNTHAELSVLRYQAYLEENGGRPNSPDIAILLTHGRPTYDNHTRLLAHDLFEHGVTLFVVGIGDVSVDDMEDIASDRAVSHAYSAPTFADLGGVIDPIVSQACVDVDKTR